MDRLLNVMTGASLLLIALVLASVRRAHIRVEYSVSWLLAGIALLVLSLSHRFSQAAAEYLGIGDAPVALLIVVGSVFLLMFFRFSVIVSRLRDNNIALAQRVAILEYRIESLSDRGPVS